MERPSLNVYYNNNARFQMQQARSCVPSFYKLSLFVIYSVAGGWCTSLFSITFMCGGENARLSFSQFDNNVLVEMTYCLVDAQLEKAKLKK